MSENEQSEQTESCPIKFTKNEEKLYEKYISLYKSPQEEYSNYSNLISKICTKCNEEKLLWNFNGNTSGRDPFDKEGRRLRRPECSECTKTTNKGKQEAKQFAKKIGIPYKAPEDTVCGICLKLPSESNKLVFDHCHKKNLFRGYLCNSCNRSIGVLGDDIDGLLRSINYLLKTEQKEKESGQNKYQQIIRGEDNKLVINDL